MASKKPETASFMVRFNQNIYDDDAGTSNVQWRGKISHVQGGDAQSFVDFEEVIAFIQEKLADLTKQSVEDKPQEEQEGILNKSLDFWKKWSTTAPKMVMETIKDPKKHVAQIQDQIQGQITQVSDEIGNKIEEAWPNATKGDVKKINDSLESITTALQELTKKVNTLSKKVK